MDKLAIIVLLFISFVAKSQCKDDYIEIVKTDTCQYIEMGIKTYARYYHADKNLKEIKKLIPEIKDSLTSLKISKKEFENNVDSIQALQQSSIDSLQQVKESWREVSYELEGDLIESQYKLNKEIKNRPKWFGGGVLSILLIILIL